MSKKGNQNIVDAIVDLQTRGYSSDFIVMDNQLFCAQQKIFLRHDEFDINEVYSFQPTQIPPGNRPLRHHIRTTRHQGHTPYAAID